MLTFKLIHQTCNNLFATNEKISNFPIVQITFKFAMKKYLDLPYFLLLAGILLLIREIFRFDCTDLSLSSFDDIISKILFILLMVYIIKKK